MLGIHSLEHISDVKAAHNSNIYALMLSNCFILTGLWWIGGLVSGALRHRQNVITVF